MLIQMLARRLVGCAVVLLAASSAAVADEWYLPEAFTECSQDKQVCFEITPKALTSRLDYFEGRVNRSNDAGGVPGLRQNWPKAKLLRRNVRGKYKTVRTFRLRNEVAPVSALVSDDGQFLVTFDNWHSVGYGQTMVVIYRADGSVVRMFSLHDFLSEEEIIELPRTISSIEWAYDKPAIHGSSLVLQVVDGARCPTSLTNPLPFTFEIDLPTGNIVSSDHSSQVRWEVRVVVSPTDMPDLQPLIPSPARVSSSSAAAPTRVDSASLLAHAISQPLPAFPKAARRGRVTGHPVFDVYVSRDGTVERVDTIRQVPLGIGDAGKSAIQSWRFKPFVFEGKQVPVVGRLELDFGCICTRDNTLP